MRQVSTAILLCCLSILFTLSVHAGQLVQQPGTTAFGAVFPRISPDGASIVFSWQGALWRISRMGGVMTQLTGGKGYAIEPTWSHDGKRIAYLSSNNFSSGEVRVIVAADGQSVPLKSRIRARGKLFFHPDGSQLLGNFVLPDKTIGMGWLDLKTGKVNALHSPPQQIRWLALSTDGTTIAYATTMDKFGEQTGNNGPQADIWQMPAAGGIPKKIIRFPSRIHDICWKGKERVLYVVADLGTVHYDIWEIPLDDPLRLLNKTTFGQADEDRPSVDKLGRWLLFTDNRNGATELVVRDIKNGTDQRTRMTGRQYLKNLGKLQLQTVSQTSGKPVTTRVVVQADQGGYFAPLNKLYRVSLRHADCFFYCSGTSSLDLPVGNYRVSVYRGFEHRPVHKSISIKHNQQTNQTIQIARWINQPAKGWYGGENHIHANYGYGQWYNTPATVLEQCEGEQLSISNCVVANSDTDGVFDREFFRGRPDRLSTPETILYWNQEFRSTFWGHMTLVNLQQLVEPIFTGFLGTTNPWDVPTNSDIAIETHRHGGLANYTHPFRHLEDPYRGPYSAKGIPVDVALGNIDTLDINSSYPTPLGTWYRLLNCGFRLPASAGTDCFLNRIRSRFPGSDRVYVQIDGQLTYAKWIEQLRAGHSFVTNGPMLEFTVNGKSAGHKIKLKAGEQVKVTGAARSQFPLKQGELIVNGKVVATVPANSKGELKFQQQMQIKRNSWIALRVSGPAHQSHHDYKLYAHSSPIFLQVNNSRQSSAEDARFFLNWIDRLEKELIKRDRIPSQEQKKHVQSQLETARKIFREMAAKN